VPAGAGQLRRHARFPGEIGGGALGARGDQGLHHGGAQGTARAGAGDPPSGAAHGGPQWNVGRRGNRDATAAGWLALARRRSVRRHWAQDAGTRTQPPISTRALRLMMALRTTHWPSRHSASAPTRRVPLGWPKRTAWRWPPPAASFTRVPGMAAAVPMATAQVPIMAWCSLPMLRARTHRSMSAAAMCLPLLAT